MAIYERKDRFYKQAKKEGYVARSAYKIVELDKKYRIFKKGNRIVDLGCAPGGWLQIAEKLIYKEAKAPKTSPANFQLIGIDLLPLHFGTDPRTLFIQGDFLEEKNQKLIRQYLSGHADWILSDMSPNISGIKFKDTCLSTELCETALTFASKVLKPKGNMLMKIFPGPELIDFQKKLRTCFDKIHNVVPEATRKTSTEIYIVALGFKDKFKSPLP